MCLPFLWQLLYKIWRCTTKTRFQHVQHPQMKVYVQIRGRSVLRRTGTVRDSLSLLGYVVLFTYTINWVQQVSIQLSQGTFVPAAIQKYLFWLSIGVSTRSLSLFKPHRHSICRDNVVVSFKYAPCRTCQHVARR